MRTSNLSAEAEPFYIFFYNVRLKAPVLKILNLHGTHYFNKSKLRKYKFDDIDNTWDFALTDDFGNVEVVLEQFEIKTAQ